MAIPANAKNPNFIGTFRAGRVHQYADHSEPFQWETRRGNFHILATHCVYNRQQLEATVPDARYITVLRDPVSQFDSAFVYYDFAKQARIPTDSNSIATFLSDPKRYARKINYGRNQLHNGQLHDLGFDKSDYSNPYAVSYKIKQLENEMDFVIITEYFDESLVLLKKILCWEVDDILYVPKRVRQADFRFNISASVQQRIRVWNRADMLLYEHFNRTLWRKIEEYGDDFWRDVEELRERVIEVTAMCSGNETTSTQLVVSDRRHHLDVVKLTSESQLCKDLYRMDGDYVNLIRQKISPKDPSKKRRIP